MTPEYQRQWRKSNPEKVKAHTKTYYKNHKEQVHAKNKAWRGRHSDQMKAYQKKWWEEKGKDAYYRSKYGISLLAYKTLLEQQNQCCGICGFSRFVLCETLHIDHDHKTGAVRGLLCSECNHGIGNFKDSPIFLTSAIAYLAKGKTTV